MTEYSEWQQAKDEVRASGDPEDLLIWLYTHPSPLLHRSAFSDEPPTHEQVVAAAVENTLAAFKGRRVRLTATDEPGAATREIWHPEGTILGIGFLAAEGHGARNTRIVTLAEDADKGGQINAVRLSHIVDIEASSPSKIADTTKGNQ